MALPIILDIKPLFIQLNNECWLVIEQTTRKVKPVIIQRVPLLKLEVKLMFEQCSNDEKTFSFLKSTFQYILVNVEMYVFIIIIIKSERLYQ